MDPSAIWRAGIMMPLRILITGKNGQLGFELQRAMAPLGECLTLNRAELDIADPVAVARCVERFRPNVIVNAAAYTAVDKAESESELAFTVNADAVAILARAAHSVDALMLHYSTDYIFNGEKASPYNELDIPDPRSVYGASKWQGEENLRQLLPAHFIFRTSWVYGLHGNNFIKTILRLAKSRPELAVVADQFGAPTGAALIADVSAQIVAHYRNSSIAQRNDAHGTYHLSAGGVTTWHAFASHIVQAAMNAHIPLQVEELANIKAITTAQFAAAAVRPANSRLDISKLQTRFQLCLPDWHQGVDQVLDSLLR